ncbi:MAG: hypothetical protein RQ875_04030 [Vicingaceae bacterium]|nr:hypothetical protein [Vicingaceae bacterium]
MKYLQSIILTFLTTIVLSQNCKTFVTGQFVPLNQSTEDSVYYLITLSSIYEFHSTKEYRKIFNLKWYDYCLFDMEFKNSSIKTDSEFQKNELLKCSVVFINDSIIELKMNQITKKLKRHIGENIWHLMMQRDNELKKLEEERQKSLKEYEAMLEKGDSLSVMLGMMKGLTQSIEEGLNLSDFELNAIGKLFNNLKTFDSESFYSNGSTLFKKEIDQSTIDQYFSYLKNVYGQWEYFSVFSQSVNSSLFGLPITEAGIEKFSFKVKFEHFKKEVTLNLTLSKENDTQEHSELAEGVYTLIEGPNTFQSINISSNDYDTSDYLDNMSSHFFDFFYNKKYTEIYKESSEALQTEATIDQIENLLRLAKSMSNDEKYKLYQHSFSMHEKYGGLITIHYVAETDTKDIYLSLTFTSDPKNHQLAGLNLQEKKKK